MKEDRRKVKWSQERIAKWKEARHGKKDANIISPVPNSNIVEGIIEPEQPK